MNNVSLIVNLASAPETRTTSTGKKLTRFRVAVNNFDKTTIFLTINAFEKNADFAEKYLKIGNKIGISGYLTQFSKTYEELKNKNGEATTFYFTEIVANSFTFCEKAPKVVDLSNELNGEDLPF